MDLTAFLIFSGALLVAVASPGPGIIALVARVIGGGLAGVASFVAGLILGDLLWLTAAVLGLAVLAHTFHEAFAVIKFAGAAYLLYLAHRMWTAPAQATIIAGTSHRDRSSGLFLSGLSVTLGNPKAAGFYLALLPNLVDLGHVNLLGYAEMVGACITVLSLVLGGYALTAARARALFASPRAARLFNRTGGTLMAGAAIAVATR